MCDALANRHQLMERQGTGGAPCEDEIVSTVAQQAGNAKRSPANAKTAIAFVPEASSTLHMQNM